MENDQQEGHQGQGRLQTGNLDTTGELPTNNNGHETAEPRQEIAAESSGTLPEKSKPIAEMPRSPPDPEHKPEREWWRRTLYSMVSFQNGYSSRTPTGKR